MHPDPAPYILASGIIGGCVGYLAAALMASSRIRRISKETWRQAALFHDRQNHPREPRL